MFILPIYEFVSAQPGLPIHPPPPTWQPQVVSPSLFIGMFACVVFYIPHVIARVIYGICLSLSDLLFFMNE